MPVKLICVRIMCADEICTHLTPQLFGRKPYIIPMGPTSLNMSMAPTKLFFGCDNTGLLYNVCVTNGPH